MTNEEWYYLKREAEKRNARFLRCDGVLYEVTKSHFTTGPSPLWTVDEVWPADVPAFAPKPPAPMPAEMTARQLLLALVPDFDWRLETAAPDLRARIWELAQSEGGWRPLHYVQGCL